MAAAGAATFISPCVVVVDVVAAAVTVDDELLSLPAADVFGLTNMLNADFRLGFTLFCKVDSAVFFGTSFVPCMSRAKYNIPIIIKFDINYV